MTQNFETADPGQSGGRSAAGLRERLDELCLQAVRFYTYNTPVAKGKYQAMLKALDHFGGAKRCFVVPTNDGRKLSVDLSIGRTVFFFGEYEKEVTDAIRPLLKKGGVYLDVGANFGWFTTLFHKYGGPDGSVHSFEPVPTTFKYLEKNYELAGRPANVSLNNLALGDEEKTITVNLFAGLSAGHASISTYDRGDSVPVECRMTTLDKYLETNSVGDVDLVKVDIEGAELMFLRGATRLFRQAVPPVMLMEMAALQASGFGYEVNDLIAFIRGQADYEFYRIDEPSGRTVKFEEFPPGDIGANVICVPRGAAAL